MRTPLKNIREAAHVEQPACKWAEERGWMQTKVGLDGWPDRLFVRRGRYVWWEFKIPVGGKLSPKQEHRISQLQAEGCEVYWGGDLAYFRRVMR